MQNKGSKRRLAIFKKFSKNFSIVMNNPRLQYLNIDFYLCPLCLKSFQELHLDQNEENPLTIEDVPPKKLNGKPILLTCKKCNNENGSVYDSELGKWYNTFCALEGKGDLDLKMKIDSSKSFKVQFSRDRDFDKVDIKSNHKNPYAKQNIDKMNSVGKAKVNFIFDSGDAKKINDGFLRFAYLYTFHFFGYAYVFSPGGRYINDYLSFDKNKEHVPLVVTNGLKNLKQGIYKISEPEDFTSFLVVFSLGVDVKKTIGILIPGPTEENINNFKLLNKNNLGPMRFNQIIKHDINSHPFNSYKIYK